MFMKFESEKITDEALAYLHNLRIQLGVMSRFLLLNFRGIDILQKANISHYKMNRKVVTYNNIIPQSSVRGKIFTVKTQIVRDNGTSLITLE